MKRNMKTKTPLAPNQKIFIDLEFLEDGKTIELISIAAVREDGAEYYAVNSEFDWDKCQDEWLREHVLPHVENTASWDKKPKQQIAEEMKKFAGKNPEFWADYASYDWIGLCQLYGKMIELPPTWPKFVRDVQQLQDEVRKTKTTKRLSTLRPHNSPEHHPLYDARDCKARYDYLCSV